MQDPWTDRLSEYLDDELPAGEREALESHLASCAECTRTLSGLRRVVAAAGALTAPPPAADLWPGISACMAATPAGAPSAEAPQPERLRKISFTLPQLVAASLLLAAASAGMAWQFRGATAPPLTSAAGTAGGGPADLGMIGPISLADQEYEAAIYEMEQALAAGRGLLDQTTIAVVEQNLAIINVAIDQARQALESDPANGYLSSHLLEARRKKLDLLRQIAAMAADAESAQS